MSYISLYRKYRSQTFEDVMGQEHVIKTLQNAIRLGKVAHAYLFCGTRGTGKTTTARLLAKALNCEKGPTPQPCNECPACISITKGSAMDILELDAASHRGIGDIKDINENVKFPPMELRFKVFIIDEAHQLSTDAKDAFLKTLEEPPAHTIFVLATTEPQSIPVTIRSRCQQFDFRRGSLRDIVKRLKYVTESENVKTDDEALELMAVSADGSWRDSLSLLEQVLAYTDGQVTAEDVNTVLGMVTQSFLFDLVDTLAEGDERGAFEAAAEAVESGRDIQLLLRSISQHFRNLLYAMVAKNTDDLTTSEETSARLRDQTSKFTRQLLFRAVEIFSEAERDIRQSDQHRLILELALLKTIDSLHSPEQVPDAVPAPRPSPVAPKAQPRQEPKPAPRQTQPKSESQTPPAEPAVPTRQDLPEFDKIEAKWEQLLQHVKSINIPAYALLGHGRPVGLREGKLVLQFEHESHAKLMMNDSDKSGTNPKKGALLTALQRVFGVANAGIICEVTKPEKAQSSGPATAMDGGEDLPDPTPREDGNAGQETLRDVLDIFNGEIMDE